VAGFHAVIVIEPELPAAWVSYHSPDGPVYAADINAAESGG
jgi:hypothetical protein